MVSLTRCCETIQPVAANKTVIATEVESQILVSSFIFAYARPVLGFRVLRAARQDRKRGPRVQARNRAHICFYAAAPDNPARTPEDRPGSDPERSARSASPGWTTFLHCCARATPENDRGHPGLRFESVRP